MKRILATTLIVQSLLWSAVAQAGWYYDVKVKRLYAGQAGLRYAVKLEGMDPNPDSCSNAFDLVVEETNPKFKEIWALLMAGYLADRPVSVYLSGCAGTYSQPRITDVMLGSS